MTFEFGVFHEFQRRPGQSEAEAFDTAFEQVDAAERWGLDAIWLAEIHMAPERSVCSVPMTIASAIAARTKNIKIGTGVQVLPLCQPLRLAEDTATVDHISHGRLLFGVGRSGFPAAYAGYGVSYEESRERFQECLDILRLAWMNETFSYSGKYFQFDNVCVMPKPYQKPHPPVRIAATTEETYPLVGRMGYPVFLAARTVSIPDLTRFVVGYHEGRAAAGHPGRGDVALSIPVYVADTDRQARDEAEASTMQFFRAIAKALQKSDGASQQTTEAREGRAQRLAEISYDDVLRERAVFGSPGTVADRLLELRETIGFSSLSAWMNPGGQIPHERVLRSMRLFAERVMPRLG